MSSYAVSKKLKYRYTECKPIVSTETKQNGNGKIVFK